MPGWVAEILHVPVATRTAFVPLTVQVEGVLDAKDTVRPDVEVAASGTGPEFIVALARVGKTIVCDPGLMVKLCVTGGALVKFALPDWVAVRVQVPAETGVIRKVAGNKGQARVLIGHEPSPIRGIAEVVTLHTEGVVETMETGRPEDAVATTATGSRRTVVPVGAVAVMDWGPGEMAKD